MLAALASPAAAPRRLAADLLQAQLLRLVRAGALIERRLGPGLVALSAHRLYRRLGFVRLGDYLTERLGMSLRRCQSIVRLERALRDLPAVAAAFDSGVLPPSKVRIVASVATAETQSDWLARAQRMTVRELEAAARAARASNGPAEPDAVPLPGSEQDTGAAAVESEDEPGVLISFAAPGRAFALWHWAIEFVRRVAGRQEPAWRCAEYLAAEFLSGCPDSEAHEAEATDQTGVLSEGDDSSPVTVVMSTPSRGAITDEAVWADAVAAVRDALRPLGAAADVEAILSAQPPAASGAGEPDPWDLDARLRGFVRLRQSLAWRQGRLLAAVASSDLYRELGYDTLGDWCRSVLGMSPRRARYLVSLDRRLDRIPLVADAYRRGLVSWCQARLLVRAARVGTESRWIRFARRVTVRHLEDVVTACAVAETDPAASTPLPAAESSPGTPSARHTLAPEDGASLFVEDGPASPILSSRADDASRHTLAPEPCTHRIAFRAPLDVAEVWRSALRACRRARGPHLRDWECLMIFIVDMYTGWHPRENAEWRRRYHILERDGWRCLAPGCTSRSHLNAHHVVFRSHSGTDDDGNLVTLCVGHHQAGVHDNRIRCYGRAPDAVWWELGVRPDGPPLVSYFGDRIVSAPTAAQVAAQAAAHASTSPHDRPLRRRAGAAAAPADPAVDSTRDLFDERTLGPHARGEHTPDQLTLEGRAPEEHASDDHASDDGTLAAATGEG